LAQNYWNTSDIAVGPYPGPGDHIRYWQATDSLENLKQRTDNKYTETSIIYKHNSYGYRTQAFNLNSTRPSILCIGCSYTYGTGVANEDSWVSLIEQRYPDHDIYNLGYPGGAADNVIRTLLSVGNKLNTKTVCVLWPGRYRFELYHPWYIQNILINDPSHQKFFIPELLNDSHFVNLQYKNQAFLKLIAEKYQWRVIENVTDWVNRILVDNGRDMHPGPATHKLIADNFINKIG
jgi:hypothetical protein